MIFRRIRGRIVPIKTEGQEKKKKVDYAGLALAAAGAAISIAGSRKLGAVMAKFGNASRIAGTLAGVFAGEFVAAEGIDRFTESLTLKKRSEQNLKNISGGLLGVIGAVSSMPLILGRKKKLLLLK